MKTKFEKIKRFWKSIKFKKGIFLFIIIFLVVILGIYNSFKSLPDGISYEGEVFSISEEDIEFFYDLTYEDKEGNRIYNQTIFDRVFEIIDSAEKYILIDIFLWTGSGKEEYRDYSQELTNHLIKRKKQFPDIEIVVITDDYNTNYNSFKVKYFEDLKENNIPIIFTNGNKLRDSNILYSPIWRTFFQILGKPGKGWIKTPFYQEKVSIKSILKLLNFKANHRKVIIADCENEMCSMIISTNPSSSCSTYSNIGILVKGDLYKDIYESEKVVLEMSDYNIDWNFDFIKEDLDNGEKDIQIQLLTEGKIKNSLLNEINKAQEGEEIKVTIFYFSDRDIINALLDASERGVDIKIIIDPNKKGFGLDKHGIPGRIVANELIEKSNGKIKIRFYNIRDEQFHNKMLIIIKKDKIIVFLGSANFTRRNLDDLNLETDVKIDVPKDKNLSKEILDYFKMIWTNRDDIRYTVDVDSFPKPSLYLKFQYWFKETTGTSTF